MRRTHYLVIILLLIAQTSFGQIYQNMAQPGYKFSRARFDSVLTIPTGLGNLKNISGGQDTGQIRFNVSDSSVYVWNGRRWVKPVGGTDTASLSNRINLKVNISDTAAMLSPYAKTAVLAAKLNISDTATMLSAYARSAAVALKVNIADTASMLSNYAKTAAVALKLNISDTATMLAPYSRVTVTSYGKNATRDSTILVLSNGTRYAAKDSVGVGTDTTSLSNRINLKLNISDTSVFSRKLVLTNRQTASYTLALTDINLLVELNVGTANTLTVPLNSSVAFAIGTKIDISQYGAGQTTITAASGVTIRSFSGALKIAGQYAAATLVKIGTNEWYCFGNLTL